jgi:hypothetical protein
MTSEREQIAQLDAFMHFLFGDIETKQKSEIMSSSVIHQLHLNIRSLDRMHILALDAGAQADGRDELWASQELE